MATKKKRGWMRYLIPGFIFQSVVIGGGYGTGAEIAQYFGVQGFMGGILGMVVTLVIWSVICAVTFEFSRLFKTYDYKNMMSKIMGPAGVLYEICYIVLLLIVLGVVNATAGSMVSDLLGISHWFGIAVLSVGIILLIIRGTKTIENVLAFWSYVLYAVYILFMIVAFTRFGSTISAEWSSAEVGSGWVLSGAQYAFYNLGIVPACLYTIQECETRKEAVTSGLLAGAIGIIPAALLLVVLFGVPASIGAEVPVTEVFHVLNMPWLYWAFEIVLFGTLIETGTGFIKAVDDRIEITVAAKGGHVPKWVRPAIAIVSVLIGVGVSSFGLTDLIAKGYGTICWGFLIFYVVPMLTLGVYKIVTYDKKKA